MLCLFLIATSFLVNKDEYNVVGTLTAKHVHLLPAVFFQFHLEERWSMDVLTKRDISRTVEKRG